MKERPIIFSTEMVKAILDGRKTMTRRTYGLERVNEKPDEWEIGVTKVAGKIWWEASRDWTFSHRLDCPYGQVGDRLWVRERFAIRNDGQQVMHYAGYLEIIKALDLPDFNIKWKPSIFMPRWASRLILEITEVRVERLQEITEEDALKEGMKYQDLPYDSAPVWQFKDLWDSLNAKRGYGWLFNPWCWVIKFDNIGVSH